MKVRMRTTYAGPRGTAGPGKIIDLPDQEAMGLLKSGYAVPAPAERAPASARAEKAVAPPNTEKAAADEAEDDAENSVDRDVKRGRKNR